MGISLYSQGLPAQGWPLRVQSKCFSNTKSMNGPSVGENDSLIEKV
jgi:hypothetical protein